MNKINSFKDLIVWRKGMDLVHLVYEIVNQLPSSEQYILRSQMLRAAISIPSNIAEGWRRKHKPETKQFLNIALGSAAEIETQILITQQQYESIKTNNALVLVDEIQRILNTLIYTSNK